MKLNSNLVVLTMSFISIYDGVGNKLWNICHGWIKYERDITFQSVHYYESCYKEILMATTILTALGIIVCKSIEGVNILSDYFNSG